ncbi:hypothetical protein ABZ801_01045 [Actinomadura sp. NPDC047616]|uniref:tail completion protein gp17 n=1 Tax=Actinomadura sp. NPDC047616 TaxID=3155914 RepID=UPI0033E55C10
MDAFPDVESLLVHLLSPLATTVSVTPPDLQDRMPIIRVRRIGGADDGITDTSRVDVDVHASSRTEAHTLAEQVRQFLLDGPHTAHGGVIDRIVTEVAPHSLTHPDPGTRVVTATYRATTRRSSRKSLA